MEIYRKNNQHYNRTYDILNLRFYTIYQLLASNHLKVDTENLSLGFVFHFTKQAGLNNAMSRNCVVFISDVLSTVIRYQYVATNKILSALRDNEFLR